MLSANRLLAAAMLGFIATTASAAIAIDVNVSKDRSTSATTLATPVFATAAGGELLLAFVSADYASGTNTSVTSIAGAGLTWVRVVRTNAQSGTAEVWRAFAPSLLSGVTVTATLSQSVAASITVMSFSGVDQTGTGGSGAIGAIGSASLASGAPSATLVTTRNNSWVFGVGTDFDQATARTAGTDQTIVHQYLATIGDTYWVQRRNSATPLAGTSVAINDTAPANHRYNLSICEILPATAGGTTWNIAGTISPAAAGSGTAVTLSGLSLTVNADSSGNYSFTGVPNGTYTATPAKTGYTFSPVSRSVTVNGTDLSAVNFAAQVVASGWSVSGTISPASSGNGAVVTLGGTTQAIADSSGNFLFSGGAERHLHAGRNPNRLHLRAGKPVGNRQWRQCHRQELHRQRHGSGCHRTMGRAVRCRAGRGQHGVDAHRQGPDVFRLVRRVVGRTGVGSRHRRDHPRAESVLQPVLRRAVATCRRPDSRRRRLRHGEPRRRQRQHLRSGDPDVVGAAEHVLPPLVSHLDDAAGWPRPGDLGGAELPDLPRRRAGDLRSGHEPVHDRAEREARGSLLPVHVRAARRQGDRCRRQRGRRGNLARSISRPARGRRWTRTSRMATAPRCICPARS